MQNATASARIAKTNLPFILIAAVVQGWALYGLYYAVKHSLWPSHDSPWLIALYTVALLLPATIHSSRAYGAQKLKEVAKLQNYARKDFEAPLRRFRFRDLETNKTLFFGQQFCAARTDDHRAVSVPLAGRIVFQMDQTASADQSLFRYIRERCEDANLDRRFGLRARCHCQKGFKLSASLYEILQIFSLTLFERVPLDQLLAQIVTSEIQSTAENQQFLFD